MHTISNVYIYIYIYIYTYTHYRHYNFQNKIKQVFREVCAVKKKKKYIIYTRRTPYLIDFPDQKTSEVSDLRRRRTERRSQKRFTTSNYFVWCRWYRYARRAVPHVIYRWVLIWITERTCLSHLTPWQWMRLQRDEMRACDISQK